MSTNNMDLRKAILLKKPLQDSFNSLNSSAASAYESAAEDSDSSLLFYSFTNSPTSFNDSKVHDVSSELDGSLVSEADNKENTTVIMRNSETEDVQMEVDSDEKVKEQAVEQRQDILEAASNGQQQPPTVTKTEHAIPEIVIEDPNENLINPFTMSESAADPIELNAIFPVASEADNRESIETDNVTRRRVADANKKSASKIPTRNHYYSPLKRKSIDQKSKVIAKPQARRTVYEPRRTVYESRRTVYETRSVKPKASILPPVDSKVSTTKPVITKPAATRPTTAKPVMQKCTFSGCLREFHTTKALQDHLRTHKNPQPVASTSSHSFKCNWCDKVFVLDTALNGHMMEKCPKIPFGEKRKLLLQQDKTNQAAENSKRKTIFAAPTVPKRRSPSKRQTLNKSGVLITPKKTLKCNCGKLFTNVLEFAQHSVAHKYEKVLNKPEPSK